MTVGDELTLRDWDLPDGLLGFADRALISRLQHWTGSERTGLMDVADAAEALLGSADRCCLVHGDLNPKNLLIDRRTLEVTGLVDWEYAHAGHPFTDLGNVLRFDRHPAYVEAVLGAYERLRGIAAEDALALARAADLWALMDLAGRSGRNPVADRAELLLRAIAVSGDLWAES